MKHAEICVTAYMSVTTWEMSLGHLRDNEQAKVFSLFSQQTNIKRNWHKVQQTLCFVTAVL